MGIIGSKIVRSARRFNVESRTDKILARDKPVPAPQYPFTEKSLQETHDGHDIKAELANKNLQLDGYLKNVFVTSSDVSNQGSKYGKPSEKARKPQYRGIIDDTSLGYVEPDSVPEGKISLLKAMQFITDCQSLEKVKALETATTQYKLNPTNAENILKYFGSFDVHISDQKTLEDKDIKKTILPRPGDVKVIQDDTKK